jgi:2-oxo-3-hexenedioate decarboxylase
MSEPIAALAQTVDEAARTATPIAQLTDGHPDLTLEQAYDVQRASIARRIERGESLVGLKMGLTSKAKMEQVGVHEPIYGHLTSSMQRSSGDELRMSEQIHPRLEPEIAFVLGDDLTGPTTAEAALRAVDSVCAALECIDSRYQDFQFTLEDVVADNASSTRFFLGETLARPDEIDLGNLGMVLSIDGEVAATGSSSAILEHPARSLAALANMLADRGESLRAGQVVLAGGATKAFHVHAGQHVHLEVDGLGTVDVHVVE